MISFSSLRSIYCWILFWFVLSVGIQNSNPRRVYPRGLAIWLFSLIFFIHFPIFCLFFIQISPIHLQPLVLLFHYFFPSHHPYHFHSPFCLLTFFTFLSFDFFVFVFFFIFLFRLWPPNGVSRSDPHHRRCWSYGVDAVATCSGD